MRFEVVAPGGIGEVTPGGDLAGEIVAAIEGEAAGVRDGDIVVVTSKIVSKHEDRFVEAEEKDAARRAESRRIVAHRGRTYIVEHRLGLVHAAAGIDNSNVERGRLLLLPLDPDASAGRLRTAIKELTGRTVGVVISDTAGRAWRIGQVDLAIGLAGVTASVSYAGQRDAHGNELRVTEMAVADEIAAAADLAKQKVEGRPVAVVRGLAHLVTGEPTSATSLQRGPDQDMFRLGQREAVLDAVLRTTGLADRYDEFAELDDAELLTALGRALPGPDRGWVLRLLAR